MIRLILVLAALAPAMLSAAEPASRRFLSVGDAGPWSGVGRLNTKLGFCTAALIAPDKALTAAHCVYDRTRGRRIPPDDMTFVADFRKGYYSTSRRVTAVRAHAEWSGFRGDKVRPAGDLAVVTLESPIIDIEGRSYEIGLPPEEGADVVLLSYGQDRRDQLSIQNPCQVTARYARSAALNCDVTFGASGSPVFRDGRIVGVISAMSRGGGRRKAFAALTAGEVADLAGEGVSAAVRKAPRAIFRKPGGGGALMPGGKRP